VSVCGIRVRSVNFAVPVAVDRLITRSTSEPGLEIFALLVHLEVDGLGFDDDGGQKPALFYMQTTTEIPILRGLDGPLRDERALPSGVMGPLDFSRLQSSEQRCARAD